MRRNIKNVANAAPHRANRLTVVAVVPIRVVVVRVEVQLVRVARVVDRGRPVVAVRTGVVEVGTIAPTGGRKKNPPFFGNPLILMQKRTICLKKQYEPICTYVFLCNFTHGLPMN